MASHAGYGQFCPVAMASEILCSRWTVPVLREMLCGSTRFNELRKGVPRMSPALLSQRLRELEAAGIVSRGTGPAGGTEYRLTRAGEELREVVETMGFWGQRWIDAEISLQEPGCVAADVGHAAPHRSHAHAVRAGGDSVSVSRAAPAQPALVADRRRRARSIFAGAIRATTSTCSSRPTCAP